MENNTGMLIDYVGGWGGEVGEHISLEKALLTKMITFK